MGTLFLSLQRAGRESTAKKEGKIIKKEKKERKALESPSMDCAISCPSIV